MAILDTTMNAVINRAGHPRQQPYLQPCGPSSRYLLYEGLGDCSRWIMNIIIKKSTPMEDSTGTRVRRLLDTSMSYFCGQLGNTGVDLTKAERKVRL
jgi:hypothetical protein